MKIRIKLIISIILIIYFWFFKSLNPFKYHLLYIILFKINDINQIKKFYDTWLNFYIKNKKKFIEF